MRTILAALLLLSGGFASAQVRVAAPVVPFARGPVVGALNLQLAPLTASLKGPVLSPALGLAAAFQELVAPMPAAVATPADFAARSAITAALASPKTELPSLVASLREAGGKKAEKAAKALEKIGRALEAAKPEESEALALSAAALNARFDGASAAPGEAVNLAAIPTDNADGTSEEDSARKLKKTVKAVNALVDVLAAAKTKAVLVVIQGMDTAGKDGVIKHGLTGVNPAYVKVSAFKKPTPEEAAQDFLERIAKEVPKSGILGVFNRSHYEDIIVPTVWGTHPGETIEARYARINAFELELSRRGVKIVKVFLHVSKPVQRERLLDRIKRLAKNWKFAKGDLETRKKWDPLQRVFGAILARTSTWYAPWTVIAADDKPGRDLEFTKLLRKTLDDMGLEYPESPDLKDVKVPR